MTEKKPFTIMVARPADDPNFDALVAATKYSRRQSIIWTVFVVVDIILACWNAGTFAWLLWTGSYFMCLIPAGVTFFSVYSARKAFEILKRAFRLWQVGCLLLEADIPTGKPPAPPPA